MKMGEEFGRRLSEKFSESKLFLKTLTKRKEERKVCE